MPIGVTAYLSKTAGNMTSFVAAEEASLSTLEHPSFGPVGSFIKGDWASQAGQIAFIPAANGAPAACQPPACRPVACRPLPAVCCLPSACLLLAARCPLNDEHSPFISSETGVPGDVYPLTVSHVSPR